MRKTLTLFLLLVGVQMFAQTSPGTGTYPITGITISLAANPDPSTINWGSGGSIFTIMATTRLNNGKVDSRVIDGKILVTIKKNGAKICGTYTSSSAPAAGFNAATKVWAGSTAVSLLGQDCILPPGEYSICVQFFGDGPVGLMPLSEEKCKVFSIRAIEQPTYQPPQLVTPSNGTVLNEADIKKPITFRWTPLVPKPQEPVTYRLRVWQLMQGQNGVQAMKANQPIVTKDVDNLTQTIINNLISGPCMPPYLCNFVWNVQALNRDGKPVRGNNGMSEASQFSANNCDVDLKLKLNSVDCLPATYGNNNYRICVSATYTSSVYNLTYSNTGSGFKAYHPSYAPFYGISNITPALQVQNNGATTIVNYCFDVIVPPSQTTIKVGLQGDDKDPGPIVCQPGAELEIRLPNCKTCDCGTWNPLTVQNAAGTKRYECGSTIEWSCNQPFRFSSSYQCSPNNESCQAKTSWEIKKDGVSIQTGSNINNINDAFTPTTNGTYAITLNAVCNGIECKLCTYTVVVKDCVDITCKCGTWSLLTVQNAAGTKRYECGSAIGWSCKQPFRFTSFYQCSPNTEKCQAKVNWEIKKDGVSIQTGSNINSISDEFTPTGNGIYTITLNAACNGIECKPCTYTVIVKDCIDITCDCGTWTPLVVNRVSYDCGTKKIIPWNCNRPFRFASSYQCSPNTEKCQAKVSWEIKKDGVSIQTGSNINSISDEFTPTGNGTYTITLNAACNGIECKPCTYTIGVSDCNVTGSICGMKFNDLNGNGIMDSGEPGLPNWTIKLTGAVILTTVTDDKGRYCFTGLKPGEYTISEVNKTGWHQTAPSSGTYSIELAPGQDLKEQNFGNKYELACITPPQGMVGWWPGDNNANDISGNNNNGALQGGASYVNGKVVKAFNVTTGADYVSVQNNAVLNFGTGNFSIDAWIKTTAATGVRNIVDKRTGTEANPVGYGFFIVAGKLAFQIGDGLTTLNHVSTTPSVSDGKWHLVAVTVDRKIKTGGKLYVDGNVVLTFDPTTRPGSVTNTAELRIGQRHLSVATEFKGQIDEVEIFNRVIANNEITSIFAADSAGKCKQTDTVVVIHDPCHDVLLCNTSFEQIANVPHPTTFVQTSQNNIPCWKTTASDNKIEIWKSGYQGVPAYSGSYFAELNATQVGTLYQTFSATGPIIVSVSFAHRGRYAGDDKMEVFIVEPNNGASHSLGTYTDNDSAWRYYTTAPYQIPNTSLGIYTLQFKSISSNNGAGPSDGGNFLDSITVTCTDIVPPVDPCHDVLLCNTSFEQIANVPHPTTFVQTSQNNIPCWKTTASDNEIEIWKSGYQGVLAYSGSYFAELNATQVGTLYQTFSATGPIIVSVSFAHRGRYAGADKMEVFIVEPNNGASHSLGTYTNNDSAWRYYTTAPYQIPNTSLGIYTLQFKSISSNNGAGPSDGGNFLDSITVTCAPVIPPKECGCGGWDPLMVQNAAGSKKYNCGDKINWKCNQRFNFMNAYRCDPISSDSCKAQTTCEIRKNGDLLLNRTGTDIITGDFTPADNGTYTITFNATCNGIKCPPCIYTVVVDDCKSCDCNKDMYVIANPGGLKIRCNETKIFDYGSTITLIPQNICSPAECLSEWNMKLFDAQTGAAVTTGNGIGNASSFVFTLNSFAGYRVELTGNCNGKICKCEFYIRAKVIEQRCGCGQWKENIVTYTTATGECGTIGCQGRGRLLPNIPYTFTSPVYNCNPAADSCRPIYTWSVNGVQSGTGSSLTYTFTNPVNHVSIKTSCNGKVCDSCRFDVTTIRYANCDTSLTHTMYDSASFKNTLISSQLIDFNTYDESTTMMQHDPAGDFPLSCWTRNGITFSNARSYWNAWIYGGTISITFPAGMYKKAGFEMFQFYGLAGDITIKVYSGNCIYTYVRYADPHLPHYFGINLPTAIDKIEVMHSVSPIVVENFRFGN